MHTVANLKDSIAGILSGLDINQVDNLDGALERSVRVMLQKADVPEASGTQNITLYDGVYDYACDPTIFGTAITDIRPQGVSRPSSDYTYKRPPEQFDRNKQWLPNGTMTTFAFQAGTPIIRIVSAQTIQRVILDPMNSTDGWVAAGSASGLTEDTAVYYQAPASLRFTLTGSSTGTLTKTLSNSIDMSSYENVGVAFLAIEIPSGATATDLTSVSLKLGSSALAYDSVTDTEGFLGAWIAGEFLLVAFDFAGATSTGTPIWTEIDYIQVSLAHTSTLTNFRVGGLWMSQPSQAQILFQSAAVFLPVGSSIPSRAIGSNTDFIILNDAAYTLLEFEGAQTILQQTGGGASDSSSLRITKILDDLYERYRGDNPSQELRMVGTYYGASGWGSRGNSWY